jgi:hypothetical protein
MPSPGSLGVNLFLGAGIWGVATALAVGGIVRRRPIGSDAAIGVVTTASFALGLALVQLYGSPGRNADALLFGNVLGVTTSDVWLIVGVALATAAVVFFFYRQLLFTTFDTQVADATGVRTAWIDALLMVVLSATVLATMSVMGVTLIAASAGGARRGGADAHRQFRHDVGAVGSDRRGERVRRDERQLPPRCRVGPDDRVDLGVLLHRRVRLRRAIPPPRRHRRPRPLTRRGLRRLGGRPSRRPSDRDRSRTGRRS